MIVPFANPPCKAGYAFERIQFPNFMFMNNCLTRPHVTIDHVADSQRTKIRNVRKLEGRLKASLAVHLLNRSQTASSHLVTVVPTRRRSLHSLRPAVTQAKRSSRSTVSKMKPGWFNPDRFKFKPIQF